MMMSLVFARRPGQGSIDFFYLTGLRQEVEKLHAKIGQLAMENDFLSKFLGRDR
jgi:hypothetical protein